MGIVANGAGQHHLALCTYQSYQDFSVISSGIVLLNLFIDIIRLFHVFDIKPLHIPY